MPRASAKASDLERGCLRLVQRTEAWDVHASRRVDLLADQQYFRRQCGARGEVRERQVEAAAAVAGGFRVGMDRLRPAGRQGLYCVWASLLADRVM